MSVPTQRPPFVTSDFQGSRTPAFPPSSVAGVVSWCWLCPPPPVILLLWCTCCRCRPSHIRKPNGSIHSSDQSHASVQKYMKKVILATWQPGNLATQQFCCLCAATPGRLAGNTGTEMITGPCINGLVILGKRGWNGHTGTEDKLTGCTGTDCHTCTEATSFTASVVWVNIKVHMSLSDF